MWQVLTGMSRLNRLSGLTIGAIPLHVAFKITAVASDIRAVRPVVSVYFTVITKSRATGKSILGLK